MCCHAVQDYFLSVCFIVTYPTSPTTDQCYSLSLPSALCGFSAQNGPLIIKSVPILGPQEKFIGLGLGMRLVY